MKAICWGLAEAAAGSSATQKNKAANAATQRKYLRSKATGCFLQQSNVIAALNGFIFTVYSIKNKTAYIPDFLVANTPRENFPNNELKSEKAGDKTIWRSTEQSAPP
jgi:hypothetical protein